MNTRRQFLITAPLGFLTAAACTSDRPTSQPATAQSTPAGAPPTFGTGTATGPAVTPATFAEAEKLIRLPAAGVPVNLEPVPEEPMCSDEVSRFRHFCRSVPWEVRE